MNRPEQNEVDSFGPNGEAQVHAQPEQNFTPNARVLLIGMMGSGKTTTALCLANLTQWPVFDNDEVVRKLAGKDTAQVLAEDGVHQLRSMEMAALHEVCSYPAPLIAGVAGGIVSDPSSRALLQRPDNYVVWLRASLYTLSQRIKAYSEQIRPWIGKDPLPVLSALYEGREALYAEVADQILNTEGCSPTVVATQILDALHNKARRPQQGA